MWGLPWRCTVIPHPSAGLSWTLFRLSTRNHTPAQGGAGLLVSPKGPRWPRGSQPEPLSPGYNPGAAARGCGLRPRSPVMRRLGAPARWLQDSPGGPAGCGSPRFPVLLGRPRCRGAAPPRPQGALQRRRPVSRPGRLAHAQLGDPAGPGRAEGAGPRQRPALAGRGQAGRRAAGWAEPNGGRCWYRGLLYRPLPCPSITARSGRTDSGPPGRFPPELPAEDGEDFAPAAARAEPRQRGAGAAGRSPP